MQEVTDQEIDEMIATLALHDDEWPNREKICLALIELREARRTLDSFQQHWWLRWLITGTPSRCKSDLRA